MDHKEFQKENKRNETTKIKMKLAILFTPKTIKTKCYWNKIVRLFIYLFIIEFIKQRGCGPHLATTIVHWGSLKEYLVLNRDQGIAGG